MKDKTQELNDYGYDLRSRGTRVKNSFLHLAGETVGLGMEAGKLAFDKGSDFYGEVKAKRAAQNKGTDVERVTPSEES